MLERAQFIAAMIRRWTERRRHPRAAVYWQDPRVQAWAARGVRDYQLKEAFERAISDSQFMDPITSGGINLYLETVMDDEGATL
jgi:hypothetical protein